jgi:hypothetical protein
MLYYERDGRQVGPFSYGEIAALVAQGVLDPKTVVLGSDGRWMRAGDVRAMEPDASPPESPPPLPWSSPASPPPHPWPNLELASPLPPSFPREPAGPWNPLFIAGSGVVFSPIWCGIMAAVNGRRLGLKQPAWRPICIAVGALAINVILAIVLGDTLLLDAAIYVLALTAIWGSDLREQSEAYDARPAEANRGDWLVPVLAGCPAALAVFVNFVVAPLVVAFLPALPPAPAASGVLPDATDDHGGWKPPQARPPALTAPGPSDPANKVGIWFAGRAVVYWIAHGGGGKGLAVVIAALGAGIAAFWRRLTARDPPAPDS